MNTELMFSSEREDWETPQNFFDELNKEFILRLTRRLRPETQNATATLQRNKTD